jgi:Ca2+-binding EF-hand superfamily protein
MPGELVEDQQRQLRQHRAFLFDADVDGDGKLSFEEFVNALPTHVRSQNSLSELRSWFRLIDADGSGEASLNEYFSWSLSAASVVSGAGVINSFQKYDTNSTGRLEEVEFLRCVEEAGYGSTATELWNALPKGADGTLDYLSLIERHGSILDDNQQSSSLKNMLCKLAWDGNADSLEGQHHLTFVAHSVATLRTELTKLLRWHLISPSELFEAMETNQDDWVTREEFVRGMVNLLGFSGDPALLSEAFENVADADGNGLLSIDELDAWIRGRKVIGKDNVRVALRALCLTPADGEGAWSADQLREGLCDALDRQQMSLEDLLTYWDEEWAPDGRLTRREFLGQLKRLVLNGVAGAAPDAARGAGGGARSTSPRLGGSKERGVDPLRAALSSAELLWYTVVRGAATDIFDGLNASRTHVLPLETLVRGMSSPAYREAKRLAKAVSMSTLEDTDLLCTDDTRAALAAYAEEPPAITERPIVRLARPRMLADGSRPLIRRHATVVHTARRSRRSAQRGVGTAKAGVDKLLPGVHSLLDDDRESTEASIGAGGGAGAGDELEQPFKMPALVPPIASTSRLLSATRARTGGVAGGALPDISAGSTARIYASLNGHKRSGAARRITHVSSLPKGISVVATRAMNQSISMPTLTEARRYRTGAPRCGMPLEHGAFELKQRVIVPDAPGFRRRTQETRSDEAAWNSPSIGLPRVIV